MRRILVGVDGSPGSLGGAMPSAIYLPSEFEELQRKNAVAELDRVVDQVLRDSQRSPRDGRQSVDVRRSVAQGAPGPTLLGLAQGADLLVVGSRGLGGFRRLLLGSVSQQCVTHAPCPVAVVPRQRTNHGDPVVPLI